MKPTNIELFRRLKQFTQELKFADYGFVEPFIWEVVEQGELTAKNLLLSNHIWNKPSLEFKSIDTLLQELEPDGKGYKYTRWNEKNFNLLLSILQSKLTDIQIYFGYFPDDTFDVYVGKTKNNVWFGIYMHPS